MINTQILEDLHSRVTSLLANGPTKDLEKNAKAMLAGVFNKMDLVTREEFDIQTQVLAKTREKLKALEARVEALEKAQAKQ